MADDLTNVPDIVRKQAEEAMRVFNAASQAAADAGHPLDGEAPKKVEAAPEAAPAAASADPAAPVVETPPAVPATLATAATEEMTKEQRYKIMEGMQKAAGRDLSRAQSEARALREELAAMQSRIATLSAVPAPAVGAPVAANVLREQVSEAFGAENVDKFFQLMRQEGFVAKTDLDEVRGEVGDVARSVGQGAYDRFQTTMEDLAPGWLQINQDPKFIEHMNEEEGNTGMTRLEFAKLHLERQDAPRLAKYFVEYGPVTAASTPPAKLDKKKFAAPPSTPGSGKEPDEKAAAPMLKTSDMARFAREVIIRKYAGNDKAMSEPDTKTWNSYLMAQREGRLLEDK